MTVPRTRWRPAPPRGNVIKALRESNGVSAVAFVGYIAETTPDGDKVNIRCEGAEGLLKDLPLPFDPPGIKAATNPDGFRFWWRQIHYAFDLPDPALIPPLTSPLATDGKETVDRFMKTTRDLAGARLMSDESNITLHLENGTDAERVVGDYPKRDLQIGFTTLLRQCHGPTDEARFDLVYKIIRAGAESECDPEAATRLQQLDAWHGAVIGLRERSLDQRVRDRLVSEEGWKVWEYEEPQTPSELIRVLNYGDLIHWGRARGDVAPEEKEYEAMAQRFAFFGAALGLAHITIGFGEVTRALTTPRDRLLLPA